MSLARQIFREMRPFFRALDDVSLARRPSPFFPVMTQFDPFQEFNAARPALDLIEDGNKYIVTADIPGIPKENVEIRIGDNGQSITIEGKASETYGQSTTKASSGGESASAANEDTTAVAKKDESSTQISAERPFTRNVSFTRTVWLPRPVDTENVTASLKDGVLTVEVNKTEDKASTRIPIN
ncbi:HSP20-like chaperone [Pholiota conissans]|uniref:HSP20-like chaperone n=1 Tax=Pholiota conissans TaxID=109636 RepID=A0A9P6CVV5_9AGAR|nr:HSP20-like chaperone [Pholiota conissans]